MCFLFSVQTRDSRWYSSQWSNNCWGMQWLSVTAESTSSSLAWSCCFSSPWLQPVVCQAYQCCVRTDLLVLIFMEKTAPLWLPGHLQPLSYQSSSWYKFIFQFQAKHITFSSWAVLLPHLNIQVISNCFLFFCRSLKHCPCVWVCLWRFNRQHDSTFLLA